MCAVSSLTRRGPFSSSGDKVSVVSLEQMRGEFVGEEPRRLELLETRINNAHSELTEPSTFLDSDARFI